MTSSTPFQIRLATQADVSGMLKIYAPIVEQTTTSFEYQVPTEGEFWQRVSKVLEESAWLVCLHNDTVVGYAYASAHRGRSAYQWNREMSVYVDADFRGRSIATALYTTLFELIKKQGYTNALIGITLPNEPSVAFHEKMGFELIGIYRDVGFKKGKYHSVGWWQLKIIEELPGDIRAIEELSEAEFDDCVAKGQLAIVHEPLKDCQ